jgi:hypothetical protein
LLSVEIVTCGVQGSSNYVFVAWKFTVIVAFDKDSQEINTRKNFRNTSALNM